MSHAKPRLHNAMWPGLVGKEDGTDHPPIPLSRMLELTAAAEVNGQKFEGVDCFLFHPHTDPDASGDDLRRIADGRRRLGRGRRRGLWNGRHGRRRRGLVLAARRTGDGHHHRHRGQGRLHRRTLDHESPAFARIVCHLPVSSGPTVSVVPSPQTTSIESTTFASPTPKWSRGSLLVA